MKISSNKETALKIFLAVLSTAFTYMAVAMAATVIDSDGIWVNNLHVASSTFDTTGTPGLAGQVWQSDGTTTAWATTSFSTIERDVLVDCAASCGLGQALTYGVLNDAPTGGVYTEGETYGNSNDGHVYRFNGTDWSSPFLLDGQAISYDFYTRAEYAISDGIDRYVLDINSAPQMPGFPEREVAIMLLDSNFSVKNLTIQGNANGSGVIYTFQQWDADTSMHTSPGLTFASFNPPTGAPGSFSRYSGKNIIKYHRELSLTGDSDWASGGGINDVLVRSSGEDGWGNNATLDANGNMTRFTWGGVPQQNGAIYYSAGNVAVGNLAINDLQYGVNGALQVSQDEDKRMLELRTIGNITRDIISATQMVSNFNGNGVNFNFGQDGGTFTGNFYSFNNGGLEVARVQANGGARFSDNIDVQGTSSEAVIGDEMIIDLNDSTFGGDTGHWSGLGWTISPVANCNGGCEQLTLDNSAISSTIEAGKSYLVSFFVETHATGTLIASLGGTSSPNVGPNVDNNNYSLVFLAQDASNLSFSPSAIWDGVITNVSIKEVTETRPVNILRDESSTRGLEIRSGGSNGLATLGNTFVGLNAGLYNSLTADKNTVLGSNAFARNVLGSGNSVFGSHALSSNTTGSDNVAVGVDALSLNTIGGDNIAIGLTALGKNTSGDSNVAIGRRSTQDLSYGDNNTGVGHRTFSSMASGTNNTAIGASAGSWLLGGNNNILIGKSAGVDELGSALSLISGDNNILIGVGTGVANETSSNQLNIGNVLYGDLLLGKIGIGITTPQSKLDIDGEVRIGNSGDACSLQNEGAVRYNSVSKIMNFCNGTEWLGMATTTP